MNNVDSTFVLPINWNTNPTIGFKFNGINLDSTQTKQVITVKPKEDEPSDITKYLMRKEILLSDVVLVIMIIFMFFTTGGLVVLNNTKKAFDEIK